MIFNVTGGGGGTGCTLTITAPVGATVTVSKDGKSKPSKMVDTTGAVVFKGLESGIWTVTITNGTDTASKTVEIRADYETEISFFTATIQIAYPAGLACTATNGSTTLNAPDTSGTWACVVPNKGTWAITAGFEVSVISATGYCDQYPVTITPADGFLGLNNTSGGSGVVSDVKVDIRAAKMIIADVDIITVTSGGNYANFKGVGLALSADKGYAYTSAANQGIKSIKLSTETGRQKMELDVENITGDWYIGFCLQQKNSINLYSLYAEV